VRVLPVLALVLAVGAAVISVARPGDDGGAPAGPSASTVAGPAPVAVSSDAPRHTDVAELVAAADVVVRGRVVAAERGRWFGDGTDGGRIQSRLITLRVDDVLAGELPDGTETVLVEEEGWLDDGRPLVVDGLAPSRVGDDGVWFLVAGGDPETGAFVILGADGRYLVADDGRISGADGDDPLVAAVVAAGLGRLVSEVRGR
jgi:hypothetical protein